MKIVAFCYLNQFLTATTKAPEYTTARQSPADATSTSICSSGCRTAGYDHRDFLWMIHYMIGSHCETGTRLSMRPCSARYLPRTQKVQFRHCPKLPRQTSTTPNPPRRHYPTPIDPIIRRIDRVETRIRAAARPRHKCRCCINAAVSISFDPLLLHAAIHSVYEPQSTSKD